MNTIGAPGRQDGVSQEETESGRHEENISSPPGYSAVPVKFSEKQQASQYLYMRQHRVCQGTQSTWPPNRTLFILNVPPYCTQESLSPCLSSCGTIKKVELKEKPDLAESPKEPKSQFFHPKSVLGFQVAYVVFQKPSGVSAALNLKGPLLPSTESHPVKNRIHKWISDYEDSVVDPEALRIEVDTFMEAYDKKIAEEETKAKEEEGGSPAAAAGLCSLGQKQPACCVLKKERPKRACKELLNFYAWQHRETKMEHLAQLRKKFEKDKQRTELMRAQRKFRPY